MIACKRGRFSLAFVLLLFAFSYLLIFSFPEKFTGFFIAPEELEVSNAILQEIENSSQAPVIVLLEDIQSIQSDVLSTLDEKDFDLKYQYSIINGFSGSVTEQGLEKLRTNPSVKGIYYDEKAELFLDKSAQLINATNVWAMQYNGINLTGKGISVCVIDTGINYSHPALAGRVIAGYDFINNSDDFSDYAGHGTSVAGVIASNDAVYRGIAPEANLIAMKASTESDMIAAIQWCLDNSTRYNISVISMSMGGGLYSNQTSCDELPVAKAANKAKAKNVLFAAAAGNNGILYKNMISSPACASNVTSVSATLQDDSIWPQSQTASFLDTFAPGNITTTSISGGFTSGCGTSLSTPHVAGAAALIYQYEKLMGLNATPDEVEKLLKSGGKQIYDSDTGMNFPRINALNSVNSVFIANVSESSFSSSNAKVKFNSQTAMNGIIEAFDISYNSISLDSGKYPQFNKSATLSIYNLNFSKQPVVLKNGQLCMDCSAFPYSGGNFTFIVQSFTNYSAGANSQMNIWDSSDSGMPYFSGNATARLNQTVYFFSNYTNISSGQIISSAICNITFSDSSALMWFNSTKNILEYSRNFSAAGAGQKLYSINCSSSDFETSVSSDSLWISECVYPGPNIDWVINESTGNVTCISENLLINQSNIIVSSGYSLTLENTNLDLVQGINSVIINQLANLTIKNSTVWSTSNPLLIYIYGNSNFNGAVFNNTGVKFGGNSKHIINNSISYFSTEPTAYISFIENSTSFVYNTTFFNDVHFGDASGDNSIVNLVNSRTTNNVYMKYNSSTTFNGNMTINTFSVTSSGQNYPKLYGNLTFHADAFSFGSGGSKLMRYYPIKVQYANSTVGISGKSANITDSLGSLVWNGTTDNNGNVIANLTLNKTYYGDGNFTLSVNPSQNISLLTTTPIVFDLSDSEYPKWSGNSTDPVSASYSQMQSYWFGIDWTDNVAVSSVLFENNFSGTLKNDSYSGNSVSTYYYSIQGLAAGTYQWRVYANDSAGNLNRTDLWIYTVAKASQTAVMNINETSPIIFGKSINVSCNGELFRNNVNATTEISQAILLGAGNYNYSCRLYENQNYSYDDYNQTFNVNPSQGSASLLLNNTSNNLTMAYLSQINASASTQYGTINLYRDNNPVNAENNVYVLLGVGYYNYTAVSTGNQNYSQSSITRFVNITQTNPILNKSLNGNDSNLSIQYPQQINASGTASGGTILVYRDGALINNGQNYSLAAGYYRFDFNITGNQNYTNLSAVLFANITKADSLLNLTLNSRDGDITITAGNSATINSTLMTPLSGYVELYLSNVMINSGNDNLSNSTSFSAGTYNITAFYNSTQNYSSFVHTHFITAQTASSNPPSSGGPGGSPGGSPSVAPASESGNTDNLSESGLLAANCTSDWLCGEWEACSFGEQKRTCTDLKQCRPSRTETRQCNMVPALTLSKLNGAWTLLLLLIPVILLIFFVLLYMKKKENKMEILIRKANNALKNKDTDRARKIYSKIQEVYSTLNPEDKKKYHPQILDIYSRIRKLENLKSSR